MADSPIRIAVELEGIEPNDRFQAALDELSEAAVELIDDTTEVSGFAGGVMGDEPAMISGVWTDMRPNVKSWSLGGRSRGGNRILELDQYLD